ncbi:MAG TPA: protein kinase [Ktedonobacteraceae bacterium]|nr:protein kinase [Ktedonobacteraceae bacterium]
MNPDIGSKLGNYRLIRLLGAGGFAIVYLGEHVYLGTRAAIKVLRTDYDLTREELGGFLNEARTIASLVHPNILRTLEFGIERDLPFLVMDYAPDGSLRSKYPRGSTLPIPLILSYVRQAASALQYAHDHGVIHCDVKPENMLLGPRNEVLLSDFGISRVVQGSVKTQEVAGTIQYMAPEQFAGKPMPTSDQYALGVVVYQWLCGHFPFKGRNVAEMYYLHLQTPPPSPRKLRPAIAAATEQVLYKALAKDPLQRFASVEAFASALEASIESSLSRTVPASLPPTPNRILPPPLRSIHPTASRGIPSRDFDDALIYEQSRSFDRQDSIAADAGANFSFNGTAAMNAPRDLAEQSAVPLLPPSSTLLPRVRADQEPGTPGMLPPTQSAEVPLASMRGHNQGIVYSPTQQMSIEEPAEADISLLLPSITSLLSTARSAARHPGIWGSPTVRPESPVSDEPID